MAKGAPDHPFSSRFRLSAILSEPETKRYTLEEQRKITTRLQDADNVLMHHLDYSNLSVFDKPWLDVIDGLLEDEPLFRFYSVKIVENALPGMEQTIHSPKTASLLIDNLLGLALVDTFCPAQTYASVVLGHAARNVREHCPDALTRTFPAVWNFFASCFPHDLTAYLASTYEDAEAEGMAAALQRQADAIAAIGPYLETDAVLLSPFRRFIDEALLLALRNAGGNAAVLEAVFNALALMTPSAANRARVAPFFVALFDIVPALSRPPFKQDASELPELPNVGVGVCIVN